MALSASERIVRLNENEERINTFVNTNNNYTTNETVPRQVKSLPALINDLNAAVLSALSRLGPQTLYKVTDSIPVNGVSEFTIPMTKVSSLLKFTANCKVWMRLYPTMTAMINDRNRLITTQAVPNDMVMWDGSTRDSSTIQSCPIPIFCNGDSPMADIAYVSIKNIDSNAVVANLSFTFIGGAI